MGNNQKFKILISDNNLKTEDIKAVFLAGGAELSRSRINSFLHSRDNRRYQNMPDDVFKAFERGLDHKEGGC